MLKLFLKKILNIPKFFVIIFTNYSIPLGDYFWLLKQFIVIWLLVDNSLKFVDKIIIPIIYQFQINDEISFTYFLQFVILIKNMIYNFQFRIIFYFYSGYLII